MSLVFNFYCIIEFAFVNYLTRVEKRYLKTYELAKKAKQEQIANEMDTRRTLMRRSLIMNVNFNDDPLENVVPSLDDMSQFGFHKFDRVFIKSDGSMRFRDQDVDVFSRYVYPIICISSFIYFRVKWFHGPTLSNLLAHIKMKKNEIRNTSITFCYSILGILSKQQTIKSRLNDNFDQNSITMKVVARS